MRINRKVTIVLGFFAVLVAGCSSVDSGEGGDIDALRAAALAASEEDSAKAYEKEIQETLRNTQSFMVREILLDGYVTDGEYEEISMHFKSCLEDAGYTDIEFGKDGSFAVRPPDDINARMEGEDGKGHEYQEGENDPMGDCNIKVGFDEISFLYTAMRENPLNVDGFELSAQCLVDTGVVEKNFTAADLEQLYHDYDMDTNPHPLMGTPEFDKCSVDPLGLSLKKYAVQ